MYKQISIYPMKFIECSIKLNMRGEQREVLECNDTAQQQQRPERKSESHQDRELILKIVLLIEALIMVWNRMCVLSPPITSLLY